MSGIICKDDIIHLWRINRAVITNEESKKKNQKFRANILQTNFLVMFFYESKQYFPIKMTVSVQPTCTDVCSNAILPKAVFKLINAVLSNVT